MNAPVLSGAAGDGECSLSFTKPKGAVKFRIRRAVAGGAFSVLATVASTSYVDASVQNGVDYAYTVRALDQRGNSSSDSNTVALEPVAPYHMLGYAGLWNGTGVTGGGDDGQVFTVSTFTAFKAAVESPVTPRIVLVVGDVLIDAGGATVNARTGGMTIDGIGFTRSIKGMHLILSSSNIIVRNLSLLPGDGATLPDAAAGIMLNPGATKTMSGILIEHNHLAWAEDVCLNIFNRTTDVSIVDNVIGPALYATPFKDGTNGYGLSMHGDAARHERISVIRNFLVHNPRRNLRAYAVDGAEYVNNVVYDWGDKLSNANPIGANFVGNMAKKGPGSQASNEFFSSELFGVDNSFFPDSIWWDDNQMWSATSGPLVPVNTFAAGVRRTTPYGGGLHNVTAEPASLALMDQVVAEAGTPTPDSLELALKADYANGTWPGDWWRTTPGAPVQPVWP